MNAEKLKRLQTQVRIGGKGTPRRKKKVMHQTAASDDKKLQSSLKKLSVSTIPGIEEVNIIKDDLTVIHFNNPKAQASLSANTFAVTGHGETKKVVEMLPEILPQLGQETVVQLRMFANSMTKNQKEGLDGQDAATLDNADDDDVPMLVSDFDEIAKKEDLRKEQMKSTAKDVDNDEKQMTAKVSNTEQHTIDIVDGSCLNKAAQSTENTAKAEVNAAKKEMTKKAGKDEHAKKEQNKPKTKNTEAQASGTQNQTNAKESAGKNAKKGAAAKESSKKTANKTEANTKQSDNVKENNKPQSAALVDTAPSPTANATAEPLKQCLNTSENNKKQEVIVEKDEGVKNLQAENTKTSKDDCEQKESIKLDNKSIESATKTNIQQQIEKKENTELQTPLPAKELKTDEGKKTEKPQTPLPSQELKTDEVKKTVKPQTLLPSQELKTDEVIKTEKPLNVEETSPTLNVSQKPNELTKNENLTEPQAKSLAISTNTPPSTNQIEAAKYELNAHKHLIELKLTDELLSLTSKSVESSKNYLKKLDDLVKDAQITAPSSEVKPMGYAEKLKAAPPPSTELPKEEPKKEDKQIKVENVKEVKEPSSMPLEKSVDLEKNKDAKEKQSSPNITAELPIQQEVPSSPSADPQVNIIDAQVMQSPIISPDIKSAQQEIKTAEHIIPKDSAFIVATEQNAITINATEIKCVQTKTLIDIENQTTGVEIMEVEAGFELPQENISSNIIKENIGDILQNIQAQADVKNSEESLDKPIATIKPMAQQEQAVPANVENLSLGNISADLPTSVDQSTLIASPPKKDSAKKDTGKTQTTPSTKSDTKKQDSGIKPKQVSPQKTATGTSSKQGVKSAPGSQSVKQEKPSTAVKPKQTTSQAKPQATTSSSPKASTPQPKKSSVSPPAEQAPKISAATKTSSPPAEQSPKLSASTKTSSPPAEQSPKTSAATKTSSPPTEQAPKISATTKTSSPPAEQSPKISAAATKTSSPPAEQSPKISAPTKTSSPPATSQATSSAKPRPSSTNTQKGAKKPKPQPEKTTPQQKATDSSPKPPSEAATPQQKPSATSPKPQTEATTPQQKS